MCFFVLPLALGASLDLLLGDPCSWPHPVRGIGRLILFFEARFRKRFPDSAEGQYRAGSCMVWSVIAVTCAAVFVLCMIGYALHPLAGCLVEAWLCYTALAARSLHKESEYVKKKLECQGLEAGREAVARIVGRDTESLDAFGVVRAAVETVAENTTDGIVSPMLFFALFGAVGAYFYKAVNTMDSMVGYKNAKYLYFGRYAAHFDDVCNWIPARLAARMMIGAAAVLGMHPVRAARIYRRDKAKQESPNAGHTEAVMAGALGISLGGDAFYFGKKVNKPQIGDSLRQVETADISRAGRLMYGTAALSFVLCMVVRGMVGWMLYRAL